jgi:Tat protein translocase TatC
VAFFGGAFIAFPVIAGQLWLFVAPGLYRSEKRALLPFLLATPVLFLLGAALAYYFVFPFAWRFFASFQIPTGGGGVPIELLPKVSEYLDLVMKLIFAFGITFQLPVAADLAGQGRDRQLGALKKYRRYAYVGMFVIAAILAPPDVITQWPRAAADRAVRNLDPVPRSMGRTETGGGLNRCTISAPSEPTAAFDAAMARRGLPPVSAGNPGPGQRAPRRPDRPAGKQARRNALAREIGQGKRAGADTAALEAEATALRDEMEGLEKGAAALDAAIRASWKRCPTSWTPTCPTARTRPPTSCWRRWRAARPRLPAEAAFRARRGAGHDGFRHRGEAGRRALHRAARPAGAAGARARPVHARPAHREHGYTEMIVPSLVNDARLRHRPSCRNSPRTCSAPPTAAG